MVLMRKDPSQADTVPDLPTALPEIGDSIEFSDGRSATEFLETVFKGKVNTMELLQVTANFQFATKVKITNASWPMDSDVILVFEISKQAGSPQTYQHVFSPSALSEVEAYNQNDVGSDKATRDLGTPGAINQQTKETGRRMGALLETHPTPILQEQSVSEQSLQDIEAYSEMEVVAGVRLPGRREYLTIPLDEIFAEHVRPQDYIEVTLGEGGPSNTYLLYVFETSEQHGGPFRIYLMKGRNQGHSKPIEYTRLAPGEKLKEENGYPFDPPISRVILLKWNGSTPESVAAQQQ